MSASVNKVILIGRLGKDPEVRAVGETSVANFSLATDESYKKNGEKVQKTEWHNIVIWGPAVENFVQPYIHKGDLVYIEGKLQTRQWTDKDENTRYTTEVNVTDIKSLMSKDSNSQPSGNQNSGRPASRSQQTRRTAQAPVEDDDIPF